MCVGCHVGDMAKLKTREGMGWDRIGWVKS